MKYEILGNNTELSYYLKMAYDENRNVWLSHTIDCKNDARTN